MLLIGLSTLGSARARAGGLSQGDAREEGLLPDSLKRIGVMLDDAVARRQSISSLSFPIATFRSRGAVFSRDRRYRYLLWRTWDERAPLCNFVMLNPSTADENHDDATIVRCRRRAERWGFGGLLVTNLFAHCATAPADLLAAAKPVGPRNDEAIETAAGAAALVVCGWGNHGAHLERERIVRCKLAKLGVVARCLSLTKQGQPGHPLYVPYDARAVLITEATQQAHSSRLEE